MPYIPSKPPPTTSDDGIALAIYLDDELSRLAMSILDDVQAVEVRPAHAAPLRPREGMLVYADGTDWNPGSGEGLYSYGSDAAWHLAGRDGSAWTAYTPTLTALAGAYTTATALGRYKVVGKNVFIEVDITVTTFGTGTFPVISLPITPFSIIDVMLNGWESALVGFVVQARSVGDGTHLYVATVSNGDPVAGANGRVFRVSGLYEAA